MTSILGLGIRWADNGATRWAIFLGAVMHLSGHQAPLNLRVQFLTHSRPIKDYLTLTYFIKNQSIGVPRDALDDLFWNFEYLTSGSFGRLLTVNFFKTKVQPAITDSL